MKKNREIFFKLKMREKGRKKEAKMMSKGVLKR